MPPLLGLLLSKGLAIGASIHSGIYFVSAHLNAVQRAVVLVLAVVCALGNGAFDALVCVTVHSQFLLLFEFEISMALKVQIIHPKFSFFATQN